MRLNLKAISIYEGIKGVSFSDFDFNSEEDFLLLLYAMYEAEANTKESFSDFKKVMQANGGLFKELSAECIKIYLYNKQFEDKKQEDAEKEVQEEPPLLSKLASTLIALELDAHFVLYDLELWQLSSLSESLEEKKREQWERERLWSYYTILPHVGSKNFENPQALLCFPWEEEAKEKELEHGFKIMQALAKNPK